VRAGAADDGGAVAGAALGEDPAARRYRTIEIQAGCQTISAADPLRDDLREALDAINRPD
jgi:hypothetical protein